ncbi:hypothetical protein CTI12_AA225140 [Artemisia annua]|uniref:RWP-RK domain-containing protein n=1 Tax=Artemisia annua TaxID=35608 RepID=A0A2U1NVI5_ARTAN|nr:hypothetical protein CTI12_AA225140 [Artemisia annua]
MEFSKTVIAQYFHLPIAEASKELNVGLTILKQFCRDMGFQRWPYRATVDDNTKVIITRLKEERRRVQENPDYNLSPSTKQLRQRNFKARHNRIKNMNFGSTTTIESNFTELSTTMIAHYFHLPIAEASKQLNVGLTVLKQFCRDNAFKRWPYRKLRSLDLLITTLHEENGGAPVDDHTNVTITRLKEERRRVQENPNYKLSPTTKKLRRRNFKARYKRSKNMNFAPTTTIEAAPLQVIYPSNISDSKEMDGDYDVPNSFMKQTGIPSLSNILHNSITIHSHTNIRSDGKIESYCGLEITELTMHESEFVQKQQQFEERIGKILKKRALSVSNMPKKTAKRSKGSTSNYQWPKSNIIP